MNFKIEKKEKNIVTLEIVVPEEQFKAAIVKAYKKTVGKYNIPGFRKGKAPMNVIVKMYGDNVFYEDAINYSIDETYSKVIDESGISPIDYPKIDIVEVGEGKDLIYKAEVLTRPEVTLGQYTELKIKKTKNMIKEDQIQAEITNLREKNSRIITREESDEVKDKDIVKINFKGFVDGEPFQGGEAENYELVVGSKSFIDNFEDQLIGHKVGEEIDVNVTFPEEYGMDTLNGKKARFEVKINEIKYKELPEVDDEFVKDITEFETVADLKADIKAKLKAKNEERILREHENKIIDTVSTNAEVDIPEVMINHEVDAMIKDLENKLKYQGLDIESYFKYTDSNEEKTRESMKENAKKKVLGELVLAEIAKKENIEVTDEEIDAKAEEYSNSYPEQDREKALNYFKTIERSNLKKSLTNEKTINFLVSNN